MIEGFSKTQIQIDGKTYNSIDDMRNLSMRAEENDHAGDSKAGGDGQYFALFCGTS